MNVSSIFSQSFAAKANDTDSQLRNLENQKMSLNSQILALQNSDNLDQELKEKKIENLEDQIETLNTQITELKKQQNTAPADSVSVPEGQEVESLDFSALPNHQPDEFVKSNALPHSPSGLYEIIEDEQGETSIVWDGSSDA